MKTQALSSLLYPVASNPNHTFTLVACFTLTEVWVESEWPKRYRWIRSTQDHHAINIYQRYLCFKFYNSSHHLSESAFSYLSFIIQITYTRLIPPMDLTWFEMVQDLSRFHHCQLLISSDFLGCRHCWILLTFLGSPRPWLPRHLYFVSIRCPMAFTTVATFRDLRRWWPIEREDFTHRNRWFTLIYV
jgi:hypothetical protein